MSTTSGHDITVLANKHLPYNHVITNHGNAYKPTTAQFVCPMDGFYAFTMSVLNGASGTDCNVALVKEGVEIGRARPHSGAYTMGSNFFIVHCQEHEAVWVEIAQKNECSFHAFWHYNTFSGFRLG